MFIIECYEARAPRRLLGYVPPEGHPAEYADTPASARGFDTPGAVAFWIATAPARPGVEYQGLIRHLADLFHRQRTAATPTAAREAS